MYYDEARKIIDKIFDIESLLLSAAPKVADKTIDEIAAARVMIDATKKLQALRNSIKDEAAPF